MKVIRNDNFNIEVFLGKCDFNIDSKTEIEEYLKKVFNRLKTYYDIEIKGFYDVYAYKDNRYGVILDIYKEDTLFEPMFNSIDMKITLQEENFLYKMEDYDFQNLGNIYYYKNCYYLDLTKELSSKEFLHLIEVVEVVYKDVEQIKKYGKKLI